MQSAPSKKSSGAVQRTAAGWRRGRSRFASVVTSLLSQIATDQSLKNNTKESPNEHTSGICGQEPAGPRLIRQNTWAGSAALPSFEAGWSVHSLVLQLNRHLVLDPSFALPSLCGRDSPLPACRGVLVCREASSSLDRRQASCQNSNIPHLGLLRLQCHRQGRAAAGVPHSSHPPTAVTLPAAACLSAARDPQEHH